MSEVQGRKLTPKQQLFVEEYLVDLNATQAAIRAGYSPKTADRVGPALLGKSCVLNALAIAREARTSRVHITQDYILANLQEIVERAMQRAPVMSKGRQVVDENGNHLWAFDAKNACRALELLGKHLGMFTGQQEAEQTLQPNIEAALRKLHETYMGSCE